MLKGLSRLWLRELARAGKAQQKQARKLLVGVIAKAKPKTKASKGPRLASSGKAGPVKPAKTRSVQLPGTWLSSYYSTLLDGVTLPARRMTYYLYLPSHFPTTAARDSQAGTWPMIVMLHGCEQTAPEFAQGTGMNRLAEKRGYAVLYAQQSLRSHPKRCWKWYDKVTQDGGGDAKMIAGMIDNVAGKYPIDRTRIYICGMSAGAALADIVALNYPELIAAVGIHSGPMFGAGHNPLGAFGVMQHGAITRVAPAISEVLRRNPAFPPMPTLLIQGLSDMIVRPINQAQLVQQCLLLNRLGPGSTSSVQYKPAGRSDGRNPANAYETQDFRLRKRLLLRVVTIAGLEHAWSGGDGKLAFNSSAKPDASQMLLAFFAKHRRTHNTGVAS